MLDKRVELLFSSEKVNLEKKKNWCGYKSPASGPQYPFHPVARVCLLPISAYGTKTFNWNRWKEFGKYQKTVKPVRSIKIIDIWSSADEAAAWKFDELLAPLRMVAWPLKRGQRKGRRFHLDGNDLTLTTSAACTKSRQTWKRNHPTANTPTNSEINLQNPYGRSWEAD